MCYLNSRILALAYNTSIKLVAVVVVVDLAPFVCFIFGKQNAASDLVAHKMQPDNWLQFAH